MRMLAGTLIFATFPTAALSQPIPHKLVITWYQSGIAVIDYSSAARCEQARKAVEAEVERRARENLAALPPGSRQIGIPANGAFCIPG